MSSNLVFRFAPSPNGRLHLGHAYSALFTARCAKDVHCRFLVRIEDIDIGRSKPEFTEAIFEDLHWLGLEWEEPVMRQSDRFEIYQGFAERLREMDLLYPCFCSRTEIAVVSEGTDPDGAPLYAGTCRHLDHREVEERLASGHAAQWRLRTEEAIARTGSLTYTVARPLPTDRPQIRYARPERWGDVVIVRKDTPASYHLSVVVDDEAQGVTNVTRGRDMEAATDIHVLLQFLFGLRSPVYTFHKLLLDDEGRKLSKSKGSPSLASLREAGWTAEAVRQKLGF